MTCNNTIVFENVIKTPLGLEYYDNNQYSIVINSDNLIVEVAPVDASTDTTLCSSTLKATAVLKEVRISGSIIYSVAVNALSTANPKLIIDPSLTNVSKAGWLSESSILPVSSYSANMVKLPYMVIKYISPNDASPTNDDIRVTLSNLDTKLTINEQGITVIVIDGQFDISLI